MGRADYDGGYSSDGTGASAVGASSGSNFSGINNYGGSNNDSNNDSSDNNNGAMTQAEFNKARGITATNPYGNQGFFSRVFGIDPSKISYANQMSPNQMSAIANNMYSKYRNPFNDPNQPAYNPSFASGDMNSGILRSGVRTGQTVIDPRTGQETTVESFRQPMSGMDTAASALASFAVPFGGVLTDQATRVKGLADQPPVIDGQQATQRGSGLLSGILGPGVEQGMRMLDQVSAKASEMINAPKPEAQAPVTDKNIADQIVRDTIRGAARSSAAPVDVRMERRPLTIQDPTSAVPSELRIDNNPIDRDPGIMDALMGNRNPPQVSGLAAIPTQEVAESNFSRPSLGDLGGIINDAIQGNYPKLEVPVGKGTLNFNVDPIGDNKKMGVEFNMPLNDMGLGGLFRLSQAQPSADGSFDVADASNSYISGNVRQGRLQNQGGGVYGAQGSSGRIYTGGGTSGYSRSKSKGSGSFLDKLGQMFSLNPYDRINS